jgi:hypothetical protein
VRVGKNSRRRFQPFPKTEIIRIKIQILFPIFLPLFSVGSTICKKCVDQNYIYCPHEEAFQRNTGGQDQLINFVLPKSERPPVLEKLNIMNVNAYSLFGNEEGLMETLAYQEIERRYL